MERSREWVRNAFTLIGVLALGVWLGQGKTVKAAPEDFMFQIAPLEQSSALMVYQPSTRSVYVYQGATTGSSNLQCSYKYVLGSRPSDGIQRTPCGIPTMH